MDQTKQDGPANLAAAAAEDELSVQEGQTMPSSEAPVEQADWEVQAAAQVLPA
jgi:hypothetical protein